MLIRIKEINEVNANGIDFFKYTLIASWLSEEDVESVEWDLGDDGALTMTIITGFGTYRWMEENVTTILASPTLDKFHFHLQYEQAFEITSGYKPSPSPPEGPAWDEDDDMAPFQPYE